MTDTDTFSRLTCRPFEDSHLVTMERRWRSQMDQKTEDLSFERKRVSAIF